jgi:hypothetical protein
MRADALTVRDVVELSRAGLGEEVLLALIEVDQSVFPIDTATLRSLKAAGVSERVIVAMVRSARTPAPAPADAIYATGELPPAPEPQIVVIDHHDSPQIREVPVVVPVFIPVAQRSFIRSELRGTRAPGSQPARPSKPAENVYWGWGGKLRPDAWQPK